ncbi:hypothetical protein HK405_006810 [Cladochytrium tenue]|nr:hypothetical protein HK405_006810 [Cladochytrium tenue]
MAPPLPPDPLLDHPALSAASTAGADSAAPKASSPDDKMTDVASDHVSLTRPRPRSTLNRRGRSTLGRRASTRSLDPAVPWRASFPVAHVHKGRNNIRTTKYTVLTFLPLFIFYQFSRFYNFYFLLGALTVIYGSSSLSPVSLVSPLVIVLVFAAAKEIIEDYSRYRSDRDANGAPCQVLRNGSKIGLLAKDIQEGDVIFLTKGEKLPVDAIIFSTSAEDGTCFVETAELDGETNLKRRTALASLSHVTTEAEISKLRVLIQCEKPNESLISFQGRISVVPGHVTEAAHEATEGFEPLSMSNMLLRGAVLRNTDFCWAVVVYTGHHTKIIKNLKTTGVKKSRMEKWLNWLVSGAFVYNAILLVGSTFLQWVHYRSVINTESDRKAQNITNYKVEWYLPDTTASLGKDFADYFISYFSLYTYVIPISLFVTMEIRVPMKANNTNLNEDLGAVDYIFSDKTGTLTQNEMRLARWYVDGIEFDEMINEGGLGQVIRGEKGGSLPVETVSHIKLFAQAVALCHDAIPSTDEKTQQIFYEAQSPDETALLYGLMNSGIVLQTRNKSTLQVTNAFGDPERFEILNTLEFNSDRKRMSVIVRNTVDNKLYMFTKGADNIINARLSQSSPVYPADRKRKTDLALQQFSEIGLRTLMVAFRNLTEEEYEEFAEEFYEASNSLSDREARVAEVAEKYERDLVLLGATAIEDRLQDQVPESIEFLHRCGIRLWVLTGDKKETAINIGMSSRLIRPGMSVLVLATASAEQALARIDELLGELAQQLGVSVGELLAQPLGRASAPPAEACLVVTGEALEAVFADAGLRQRFLRLGLRCHSVVCCRVTPLQKALVVRLVRDGVGAITLAIGDGANDVSMIQAAHVGVGIRGREGTQAVRSSDYAFGEFRFLIRLLTVHGRYSYMRLAGLIFYSLYKNLTFITVQWWFGFFSDWSGETVYENIFFVCFNVIFTSLPPLFFAIFEKDVDEDDLERYPELYAQVRAGTYWNWIHVVTTVLSPLWHSIVIFFGYLYLQSESILDARGRGIGFWVQCFYLSTPMLLTVLLKMCLQTRHFVWVTWLGLLLSVAADPLVQVVVEATGLGSDPGTSAIQHAMPAFYLTAAAVPVACLLPDVSAALLRRLLYPSDVDLIAEAASVAASRRSPTNRRKVAGAAVADQGAGAVEGNASIEMLEVK